jgi:hypothetical protein
MFFFLFVYIDCMYVVPVVLKCSMGYLTAGNGIAEMEEVLEHSWRADGGQLDCLHIKYQL